MTWKIPCLKLQRLEFSTRCNLPILVYAPVIQRRPPAPELYPLTAK